MRSTHAETALATMRSIRVAERTNDLVVGISRGGEGACERRARWHGPPHISSGSRSNLAQWTKGGQRARIGQCRNGTMSHAPIEKKYELQR